MNDIQSFYCPTHIYMGIDSHRKVDSLIKDWKAKELFLLVDQAMLKTEIYSLLDEILKKNNVSFEIFTEIEPDPSANTVAKAYELYKKSGASTVLAIGGGSTMDVGKAVGILATNGGRIPPIRRNREILNSPTAADRDTHDGGYGIGGVGVRASSRTRSED